MLLYLGIGVGGDLALAKVTDFACNARQVVEVPARSIARILLPKPISLAQHIAGLALTLPTKPICSSPTPTPFMSSRTIHALILWLTATLNLALTLSLTLTLTCMCQRMRYGMHNACIAIRCAHYEMRVYSLRSV